MKLSHFISLVVLTVFAFTAHAELAPHELKGLELTGEGGGKKVVIPFAPILDANGKETNNVEAVFPLSEVPAGSGAQLVVSFYYLPLGANSLPAGLNPSDYLVTARSVVPSLPAGQSSASAGTANIVRTVNSTGERDIGTIAKTIFIQSGVPYMRMVASYIEQRRVSGSIRNIPKALGGVISRLSPCLQNNGDHPSCPPCADGNCQITVSPIGTAGATGGSVTSSVGSISCNMVGNTKSGDCEDPIPAAGDLVLTAIPNAISRIGNWTGCTSFSGATCTVSVADLLANPARAIGVYFYAKPVQSIRYDNRLTVTSNNPMGSCGTNCTQIYQDSFVTFTAPNISGYTLSWVGCPPGGVFGNVCRWTIGAIANIIDLGIVYTPIAPTTTTTLPARYELKITKTGTSPGSFSASPNGFTTLNGSAPCTATCGTRYLPANQLVTVTLNATAPVVGTLLNGTVPHSLSFNLNTNKNLSANFAIPPRYAVTIGKVGMGTVSFTPANSGYPTATATALCTSSTCTGTTRYYPVNATVRVNGVAAAGSVLHHFSGVCSGTSCSFTMPNNLTSVTAHFEATRRVDIGFRLEPGTTACNSGLCYGYVDDSIAPSTIYCTYPSMTGSTCAVTLPLSGPYDFFPVAGANYRFIRWDNCPNSVGNNCQSTAGNTNATIYAVFGNKVTTPTNGTVTLGVTPIGSGSVSANVTGSSCTANSCQYPVGTNLTVTASPAGFVGFTSCPGTQNLSTRTCSFTVTGNHSVIANFPATTTTTTPTTSTTLPVATSFPDAGVTSTTVPWWQSW